ncbi:UNVERIFIED_CONTAM: hypothetical protein K2H54_021967 [Gekko kuhli]
MQTVGSLLSGYLKDKNGVSVIPKDGLDQLVKEQFPHCEKFHMIDDSLIWELPMRSNATVKVISGPTSM